MSDIRVAVVGAGIMGADHIRRITERIAGARVSWIIEPDDIRAHSANVVVPSARTAVIFEEALEGGDIDAVLIASPGQFHEATLISAIEAQLPILCEKPLTPDPESALRVLAAEQKGGKKLVQVGFMRRFDKEYIQLQKLINDGTCGELLGLRCQHRNAEVADTFTNRMLINDSVVHEIDIVHFLTGSPIKTVEVKHMRRNRQSPEHLREPILVLLETESGILADVELNTSIRFGYQVKTEAVFEQGIAEIGRTSGMTTWSDGHYHGVEHLSYITRFADAYDFEVRNWIKAVRDQKFDGPNAWDGYLAAATCKAGVEAMETGLRVEVEYIQVPSLYK